MDNRNQQVQRETNLAKTLFLITGASLLTWLPFQIVMIWPSLISSLEIIYIIKLLQFSNSLVNVIIYPFRISEFKGALFRMLQGFVTPFCRKTRIRGLRIPRTEDKNETSI